MSSSIPGTRSVIASMCCAPAGKTISRQAPLSISLNLRSLSNNLPNTSAACACRAWFDRRETLENAALLCPWRSGAHPIDTKDSCRTASTGQIRFSPGRGPRRAAHHRTSPGKIAAPKIGKPEWIKPRSVWLIARNADHGQGIENS